MSLSLPIQECIPDILNALESHRCAVIQAPPGAGKTTRIPLALLGEPWLGNKKIILLEPRRLAAMSCAEHMAGLLKETVGQTIGYQIRMDRKIGPDTRIEVVTEGIFTRKIQNDPSLEDIGIVIFDEFHERHIHSDLGLAFCLEIFEALREDLRILVMSATMDVLRISSLMIRVLPLYGNLSQKEQINAFCPSGPNERKIVIATSIAETSITIEGVRVVIDAGLMRLPRFSPQTGMTRLETLRVSKASADQRRGRAGRTAPGKCYRLWSEYEHRSLKPHTKPEILNMDLAGVALELSTWGVANPNRLNWLNPPDKTAFKEAKKLLKTLGAIDEQGKITPHGKIMSSAGLHPRLSHMVITSDKKGQGFLSCRVAALLNEKDFVRFDSNKMDPDIRLRLEIIDSFIHKREIWQKDLRINKTIIHRIIESEKKISGYFGISPVNIDIEKAGMILAYAYPDRIAQKRNARDNTFLMASGKGAFFTQTVPVSLNQYIVAVHLDGSPQNAKIFLAAPYCQKDFEQDFYEYFKIVQTVFWDKKKQAVRAKKESIFEKLVVHRQMVSTIDPDRACDLLIAEIQKQGIDLLPWTKRQKSLKERAVFLKNTGQFPELPDLSDHILQKDVSAWLKPFLAGILSVKQLGKIDLNPAFLSLLTWKDTCYPSPAVAGRTSGTDHKRPCRILGDHLQECKKRFDGPVSKTFLAG